MPNCQSQHLDQFYDVIRVDVRLECDADGWTVHELHRHETGQMGRCAPSHVDHLTWREALDVLDALASELLPPAHPLSPPRSQR